MNPREFTAHYILRGEDAGQPFAEHYQCNVTARGYAEAFDEGWAYLTRSIATERYDQVDFVGLTWNAHPQNIQDSLNEQYSMAHTMQNLYAEENLRGWDDSVSDEMRLQLRDKCYEQQLSVENTAKDMMRDGVDIYPPQCFLALPWAEWAVFCLYQVNFDIESHRRTAEKLLQLIDKVRDWEEPPKGTDKPYYEQLLLTLEDITMSDHLPPQIWDLNNNLHLYKPYGYLRNSNGGTYTIKQEQLLKQFYTLQEAGKMAELKKLVEEITDPRWFTRYKNHMMICPKDSEIERIVIKRTDTVCLWDTIDALYRYAIARDKEVLRALTKQKAYRQDLATDVLEKCMRENDFGTAGYLLRQKVASFDDFAQLIADRKHWTKEDMTQYDGFISRLEKYNREVVQPTLQKDLEPSTGRGM